MFCSSDLFLPFLVSNMIGHLFIFLGPLHFYSVFVTVSHASWGSYFNNKFVFLFILINKR